MKNINKTLKNLKTPNNSDSYLKSNDIHSSARSSIDGYSKSILIEKYRLPSKISVNSHLLIFIIIAIKNKKHVGKSSAHHP